MFLTGLALLPAIALVVWIYRQDKVEKEPGGIIVENIPVWCIVCDPRHDTGNHSG